MKRFFERIQQKASDVSEPPVLIVAFGDSVTQGCMELHKIDSAQVYHRLFQMQLEAAYPHTTFSTINAGVAGGSLRGALSRTDRDIVRHQPDLVLVAFGLNDCGGGLEGLPDFENALREVIATIREKTEADIVLITPPFMATKRTDRIHADHLSCADPLILRQTDGTLAAYAEAIRCVARESDIPVSDVYAEWQKMQSAGVDIDDWLANGLNHPDPRGHLLAAETLGKSVKGFSG